MSTVAELKQNAEQCFYMAERERDRDLKVSWSRLAETWLSLADQENRRRTHQTQGTGSRRSEQPRAA
jgi:hypothetical protein